MVGMAYKIILISKVVVKGQIICKDTVFCYAKSYRPEVLLSKKILDFGKVMITKTSCMELNIINHSNFPSTFIFQIDNCMSWFKVEPCSGVVTGLTSKCIQITFKANIAMTYFAQIPCIIHNCGVQYLNILGTCFEDKILSGSFIDGTTSSGNVDENPVLINQYHLYRYMSLWKQGLSFLNVQQLSSMFDNGDICWDDRSDLIKISNKNLYASCKTNATETEDDQYFNDGHRGEVGSIPHISTNIDMIDFGTVCAGSRIKKEFFLTNHTRGPIQVSWNSCSISGAFTIEPCCKVVEGEQSAMFIVGFNPLKPNHFFFAHHYAVIHPTPFLKHYTTDERVVFPPWFIDITIFAQTFNFVVERFVPYYQIDPSQYVASCPQYLKMVSLEVCKPVYRTICVYNKATTPMLFEVSIDESNINNFNSFECISYKPEKSVIPPNDCQCIMVKYVAKSNIKICKEVNSQDFNISDGNDLGNDLKKKNNIKSLLLKFNDDAKYIQKIFIETHLERPRVQLNSSGHLTIRPTYTGCSNNAQDIITNMSCVPIKFNWIIPKVHEKFITVDKLEGILNPYESKDLQWTFNCEFYEKIIFKIKLRIILVEACCPKQLFPSDDCCESKCVTNHKVLFTHFCDDGTFTNTGDNLVNCWVERGEEQTQQVVLVGHGIRASIESCNKCIDFGPITTKENHHRKLTQIYNNYNCDVYYKLHIKQVLYLDDKQIDCDYEIRNYDLCDNLNDGVNEVGSIKCSGNENDLALRIYPMHGKLQSSIRQELYCNVCVTQQMHHMWIVSYTLHNNEGKRLDHQPQAVLCKIFGRGVIPIIAVVDATCDNNCCISPYNLWSLFSIDEMNKMLKQDSNINWKCQSESRSIDLNFLPAPLGSHDCIFLLTLKNVGSVDLHWDIIFPSDLKIDIDRWAEPVKMSPADLHQMQIIGNQIFAVSHTKGFLKVGCCCCISFTYRHILQGNNQLPVIFTVKNGNEIQLNFNGTTLPKCLSCLFLFKKEFYLKPTYIGFKATPIQYIDMYNGGDVALEFVVDLSNLNLFNKSNYNHDILQCTTSNGSIEPGNIFQLGFIFNPIEVKLYVVELPIYVNGQIHTSIIIKGFGEIKFTSDSLASLSTLNRTIDQIENVGSQQYVPSGKLCVLTRRLLDFNDVPTNCLMKMMTTMMNISQQDPVTFKWFVKNQGHSKVMSIEPSEGRLNAKQSVGLVVTLNTQGFPQHIQTDLICETTSLVDIENYNKAMFKYIKKREELRDVVDFEGVDVQQDDVNTIRNTEIDVPACDDYLSRNVELIKYQTFPKIIKPESLKEQQSCLDQQLKTSKFFLKKSQPPTKHVLSLHVRATSHSLDDFESIYKHLKNKFFIDRSNVDPCPSIPFDTRDIYKVCDRDNDQSAMNDKYLVEPYCVDYTEFNNCNSPVTNVSFNNNNFKFETDVNRHLSYNNENCIANYLDINDDGIKDYISVNVNNYNNCGTLAKSISKPTFKMLNHLLSSLIRDVVEDESFLKCWMLLCQEAVPYFQQFTPPKDETADITSCGNHYEQIWMELLSKKKQDNFLESKENMMKRRRHSQSDSIKR